MGLTKKLRNCIIKRSDIGQRFLVYNGKVMCEVRVQEGMEGSLFGLYALTKRMGPKIHLKIKKNKKKR